MSTSGSLNQDLVSQEASMDFYRALNYNARTEDSLFLLPSETIRISEFYFPFSHLVQSLFPDYPYAWDVRAGHSLRTYHLHLLPCRNEEFEAQGGEETGPSQPAQVHARARTHTHSETAQGKDASSWHNGL